MKERGRNSQISIEYLTTYGWMFIIVLIVSVMIFSYVDFNFILPEKLDFKNIVRGNYEASNAYSGTSEPSSFQDKVHIYFTYYDRYSVELVPNESVIVDDTGKKCIGVWADNYDTDSHNSSFVTFDKYDIGRIIFDCNVNGSSEYVWELFEGDIISGRITIELRESQTEIGIQSKGAIRLRVDHINLSEPPVSGVCDLIRTYMCVNGTFLNVSDNSTHYLWDCLGLHGGSNAMCNSPIIFTPVNGVCDLIRVDMCTNGTFLNVSDNSTHYLWDCVGLNGGSSSSCSKVKPVNGICDLISINMCINGTSYDISDNSTHYLWDCLGLHGGSNSSCSKLLPPTPINGVCDLVRAEVCTNGTFLNVSDNSTHYLWDCVGLNGGSNSSCNIPKPVNGICDLISINMCINGTFLNVSDNSTHYLWDCLGLYGGSNSSCNIPKPVNGICDLMGVDMCINGTFQDVLDNSNYYLWNCLGLFGGNMSYCSIRKPVNGVCDSDVDTCDVGTFLNTSDNSTHIVWNCNGLYGGINAVCSERIVEDAFISVWRTTELSSGSSNSNQIKLPLRYSGTYNFVVDWGDGTNDTITSWYQPEVTHTYATPGEYEVRITGEIVGFTLGPYGSDREKIIDIRNWGTLRVGNTGYYFSSCSNLDVSAADVLNLTGTTNLEGMFFNADSFNGDLSSWDVSSVTDMRQMFSDTDSFNSDLSSWDVSSVTDMVYMFSDTDSFDSDLSSWDVSSVTDMRQMFFNADSFDSDLSNWNVSSVTDMSSMFSGADSFDSDLSSWDVSSVTDISSMFYYADSFNSNLSNWNVSSVTDMSYMFWDADSFNGDLSSWDVSSVTDMSGIFISADSFNGDLSGWDVSSVTDMTSMFSGAHSFNSDLSGWNVNAINSFLDCISFSYDTPSWTLPKPTFLFSLCN